MRTNRDTRRARLRLLCDEAGGQSALATLIDKDRRQVSAWLTDPAKAGGKAMSDSTAREIERRCRKPVGWLDAGDDLGDSAARNNSHEETPIPSQSARLDRGILHDALTLLIYDELHAGDYTPRARTDRLAELYEVLVAAGGRLSKEQNAAFVQQVSERHQEATGGSSGAVDRGRRKGWQGASGH